MVLVISRVVSCLGVKFHSSTSNISWLLKGLGESANRNICLVLYLVAAITGILAALSFFGILFSGGNWQLFAIITAVFSSLSLILFPNALAMFFNKAGAIAVNLLIYYSVVFQQHWPAAAFED